MMQQQQKKTRPVSLILIVLFVASPAFVETDYQALPYLGGAVCVLLGGGPVLPGARARVVERRSAAVLGRGAGLRGTLPSVSLFFFFYRAGSIYWMFL